MTEFGNTGAQNVMYGVLATLVNITNSYDKQELNPDDILDLAMFAKHRTPEEMDDCSFADKMIWSIAKMGVTFNLNKAESHNIKELTAR